MIPRPNRPDPGAPRTWADARAVADRLCVSEPPSTATGPGRYEEYVASQLVAALLLAAAYTGRPALEAVTAWLRDPGAIEDTARPTLQQVADTPGTDPTRRRDARAALAILRRNDHDQRVAATVISTARRQLQSASEADNSSHTARARNGGASNRAPAARRLAEHPGEASTRRIPAAGRTAGGWSR